MAMLRYLILEQLDGNTLAEESESLDKLISHIQGEYKDARRCDASRISVTFWRIL